MWQVGQSIENRYQVLAVFGGPGKSGLGVVYRVLDLKTKQVWALKTFQDEVLERQPGAAADFRREALHWIALDDHPHIVRAHRLEHFDGQPYLFLEWLEGGDLSSRVGRFENDATHLLTLALQFCDAMTHASEQGLQAHRDIKPANCLLDGRGALKITDFGLAKALAPAFSLSNILSRKSVEQPILQTGGEGAARQTQAGAGMGTLPYMAPEQFERARDVDVRADVYSFGVMMWELVTGRLPFLADNPGGWYYLHKNAPIPSFPLRHFVNKSANKSEWRKPLGALLQRCLSKNPRHRPRDFTVIRLELEPIFRDCTHLPAPPVARAMALDASDYRQKGWSQLELGMPRAALASFREAQVLAPREGESWAGEIAARRALGESQTVLSLSASASARFPNCASVHLWHARTLREAKKLEAAREAIQIASQLDEKEPDFWVELGLVELALSHYNEAAQAFKTALKVNPRHEEAWTNLALACRAAGHDTSAMRAAKQALDINPRHEPAIRLLDEFELAAGRGAQLLERLDERIAKNPQRADLWLDKGRVLLHFERPREAIECLDRALALDPRLVEAHSKKARVWAQLGRLQEGLKCAEAALERAPHDGEAHFVRGELLVASGRDAEAFIAFWHANVVGFAPAHEALENCRSRLTELGEAIPDPEASRLASALNQGGALAQERLRAAGEIAGGVVTGLKGRLPWPSK